MRLFVSTFVGGELNYIQVPSCQQFHVGGKGQAVHSDLEAIRTGTVCYVWLQSRQWQLHLRQSRDADTQVTMRDSTTAMIVTATQVWSVFCGQCRAEFTDAYWQGNLARHVR